MAAAAHETERWLHVPFPGDHADRAGRPRLRRDRRRACSCWRSARSCLRDERVHRDPAHRGTIGVNAPPAFARSVLRVRPGPPLPRHQSAHHRQRRHVRGDAVRAVRRRLPDAGAGCCAARPHLAGRDLHVPARQPRRTFFQHAGALDVRHGAGTALGHAVFRALLLRHRDCRGGLDHRLFDGADGDDREALLFGDDRRLRRDLRIAAGLRADLPQPAAAVCSSCFRFPPNTP